MLSATVDNLLQAVKADYIPTVEALLETVNVNAQNKDGYTALHIAAAYGLIDMTKFLLENGADIHQESNRLTALVMAVSRGHTEVVELLFHQGARIIYSDPSLDILNLPLLHHDETNPHLQMIALLISLGARITTCTIEWLIHYPKILTIMIKSGLDPDAKLEINDEGEGIFTQQSLLQVFAAETLRYAQHYPEEAFPSGIQALAKAGAIVDFEEPEKIDRRIAALFLGEPGDEIPGTPDKRLAGKVHGALERRLHALLAWAACHPENSSAATPN